MITVAITIYLAMAVVTVPFVARRQAEVQNAPRTSLCSSCAAGRNHWRGDGTVGSGEFISGLWFGLIWPLVLLYLVTAARPTNRARAVAAEQRAAALAAELADLEEQAGFTPTEGGASD